MKKEKIIFVCSECGCETSKWVGQCPECGSWNTMQEETVQPPLPQVGAPLRRVAPTPLFDVKSTGFERAETGISELDRVLGGGLVSGSVVLISGEPGIGKSTLLLQICDRLSQGKRVLYLSGEESLGQIKLRAERLGIEGQAIQMISETDLDSIVASVSDYRPDVLIVDSIQTVFSARSRSVAGSIAQVKEAAAAFISLAKSAGGPSVFLVGHVNKEGGISGPKMLEHMVDAVLYFEGDRRQSYRIIRAMKNRYGSTNEIGVFDMTDRGLCEVPNPSETLLGEREEGAGSGCPCPVIEGTRPVITEVQSLVSPTVFPSPKRTADGLDYNRLCLLIAVLEKRLNLRYSTRDVYINVAGGLRLDDIASDLAVTVSLLSGFCDAPVPKELIAFGEVGLGGEVRSVARAEQRINESVRLGFTTLLLPKRCLSDKLKVPSRVRLVGISHIREIMPFLNEKK